MALGKPMTIKAFASLASRQHKQYEKQVNAVEENKKRMNELMYQINE